MEIEKLIRKNIWELQPYSCAREEYEGGQAILLDANENPFDTGVNRYPDPYQRELKKELARLKEVKVDHMILGNGSDELIDLLIRSFCEPAEDNIVVFSPGYAMYEVSAAINRVGVKKIDLTADLLPDWSELRRRVDDRTKLIFLCTPNNPTGKVIPYGQIERLCGEFQGMVIVDEAYIDFTDAPSAVHLLDKYRNVVVLQTLSKAWGMAGLRLGIGLADPEVVGILNRVKAPYNIGGLTQQTALALLRQYDLFQNRRTGIILERERLIRELRGLGIFRRVYDSEANFILVITEFCQKLYRYLIACRVVVRLRDIPPLIGGGIRITVGTREENDRLLEVLHKYDNVMEVNTGRYDHQRTDRQFSGGPAGKTGVYAGSDRSTAGDYREYGFSIGDGE